MRYNAGENYHRDQKYRMIHCACQGCGIGYEYEQIKVVNPTGRLITRNKEDAAYDPECGKDSVEKKTFEEKQGWIDGDKKGDCKGDPFMSYDRMCNRKTHASDKAAQKNLR
jgi:hypothetical protein